MANPLFHLIFAEFQPSTILKLLPPSLGLEIPIKVTVTMPYSPANKEAMMKLVRRSRPFTDYTSAMMKYEARYEEFVNKRYKEPEDGNFEDATREILEAVSGDSNIGDDEEMEPVAAIAAHLADIILMIFMLFLQRILLIAIFPNR